MSANDELKDLMGRVPLTQPEVAGMTESAVSTVKGWCSAIGATRYRNMPSSKLKLLKIELREIGKLPTS